MGMKLVLAALLLGAGLASIAYFAFGDVAPPRRVLKTYEGDLASVNVEEVKRGNRVTSSHATLKLTGVKETFVYDDQGRPDPTKVLAPLHEGDHVTLLGSPLEAPPDSPIPLWGVSRDGESLVSYEDIEALRNRQKRALLWVGLGFLAVSGTSGALGLRDFRREQRA